MQMKNELLDFTFHVAINVKRTGKTMWLVKFCCVLSSLHFSGFISLFKGLKPKAG